MTTEAGGRATFYTTGMEHPPTAATGSARDPTPWRAVQGAASGGAPTGMKGVKVIYKISARLKPIPG